MSAALTTWTRSPFTWAAAALIAVVSGMSLWLSPPRGEVTGSPAEVTTAKVAGYCATVIAAGDGTVWALPPGSRDGKLRLVDPADVDRTAEECQR